MFNFFKKRKMEKSSATIEQLAFYHNVYELLEKNGFPKEKSASFPKENLIMYFGIIIAESVFAIAMGKDDPWDSTNEMEKAAILVIFSKAANMGYQMAGMKNPELGSIIMQNGTNILLGGDLDHPTPNNLGILALASSTYKALLKEQKELMDRVAALSQLFLAQKTIDPLEKLAVCWQEIMDHLDKKDSN